MRGWLRGDAPQVEGAGNGDAPGSSAPGLLQGADEIPPSEEDPAEGLARGVESEDAAGEEAELA